MHPRRIFSVIPCIFVALSLRGATLGCPSAGTLEQLAVCIRSQMPASGSNGFVSPTATEQAAWREVIRRMMDGQCNFELPPALQGAMNLRTFVDSQNNRSYCLFMETTDANDNGRVDRGWGTFIVDRTSPRELSHQAPHPIADSTTEVQAIGIFKGTASRSYLMAGAHRNATSGSSVCQPEYGPADAAHNVDNMFHATNAELLAHYGARSWTAIQWHGMAADTCPVVDVYLSHGVTVAPVSTDRIAMLRMSLLRHHPNWRVETPGTGACTLNATDNTQGRLLNGVNPSTVCSERARAYSGTFLHIEQDPAFRDPTDWIQAIIETFPPNTEPQSPRRRSVRAGD